MRDTGPGEVKSEGRDSGRSGGSGEGGSAAGVYTTLPSPHALTTLP